jgi:hypothetical protein
MSAQQYALSISPISHHEDHEAQFLAKKCQKRVIHVMKSFRHVTTSHCQTKRLKSIKINGLVHELYLDLVTQSICPACKAWHHRPGAWNKPMPTSSVKWRADVFDFICTPDQLRIRTPSLLFLFPCLELASATKSQKATGMHQHNIPTYTNSSSLLYLIPFF